MSKKLWILVVVMAIVVLYFFRIRMFAYYCNNYVYNQDKDSRICNYYPGRPVY